MRQEQEPLIYNPNLGAELGFEELNHTREVTRTVKALISIWQKHIPYQEKISVRNGNRNRMLLNVFKKYFKNSFASWKKFVLYITKSDQLLKQRRNFRFCFNWAIQEENLERILRGRYHCQVNNEVVKSLKKLDRNNRINLKWKKALQEIAHQMGKDAYMGFSSRLKFVGVRGGILTFKTSQNFKSLYSNSCYYKRRFSEILQKHFGDVRKINLVSNETEKMMVSN